jgi:hypothetical protein
LSKDVFPVETGFSAGDAGSLFDFLRRVVPDLGGSVCPLTLVRAILQSGLIKSEVQIMRFPEGLSQGLVTIFTSIITVGKEFVKILGAHSTLNNVLDLSGD